MYIDIDNEITRDNHLYMLKYELVNIVKLMIQNELKFVKLLQLSLQQSTT